jgi:hypothetical protein
MLGFMPQLFYPNTHLIGASVDPKGGLDMTDNRKIPYLGWMSKSGKAATKSVIFLVSYVIL